jgi:hypothetical protein
MPILLLLQGNTSETRSEAQAKITQQGQELSSFEPIKSVIEQHKDIFERNGVDFSDGLGRLLNAERMLEQNPTAAIAQIAQTQSLDMPISTMVARLIRHDITRDQAIHSLMSRPLRKE